MLCIVGYKALALCRKQPNFIEKVNELTRTHCSTSRFTPVFAVGKNFYY